VPEWEPDDEGAWPEPVVDDGTATRDPAPRASTPRKLTLPKPIDSTGPSPARPIKPAPSPPLPAAIPSKLFELTPEVAKPKRSIAKPVLSIALLCGAAYAAKLYFFRTEERAVAPRTDVGTVYVVSTPPGAEIVINGTKTGFATPHEVGDLPLEVATRIAVRMARFKSFPLESTVKLQSPARAELSFKLRPARILSVETDPPGAEVALNGAVLPSATPCALPPLAIGEHAQIEVEEEDYLRAKRALDVSAQTSTTTHIKLQRARMIDVVSEPDGAFIYVDGELRAKTPKHGLKVPAKGAFSVRLDKPGFRIWLEHQSGGSHIKEINAKLKEEPILQLALTHEERKEGARVVGALEAARRKLGGAKRKLSDAERVDERVTGSTRSSVVERARAEAALDDARTAVEEAEAAATEAQQAVDGFRGEVIVRLEREAERKEAKLE
jgi:hypothetical protein